MPLIAPVFQPIITALLDFSEAMLIFVFTLFFFSTRVTMAPKTTPGTLTNTGGFVLQIPPGYCVLYRREVNSGAEAHMGPFFWAPPARPMLGTPGVPGGRDSNRAFPKEQLRSYAQADHRITE